MIRKSCKATLIESKSNNTKLEMFNVYSSLEGSHIMIIQYVLCCFQTAPHTCKAHAYVTVLFI